MSDRQLIADLLSALEYHTEQTRPIEFSKVAIEAAREYLSKPAQPQQEPVAWADMEVRGEDKGLSWTPGHFHKTPLYTAPPQRKPLTDEEIERACVPLGAAMLSFSEVARAIEAAHGIKGEA